MKHIIIEKKREFKKDKYQNSHQDTPLEISNKKQIELINQIYLGLVDLPHKEIIRDLKKKINSYKSQDEKKERYDANTFISSDELYEKLVASKLRCNYCSQEVKIKYFYIRDNLQWTLDRIDNNIGHSSDNTVICCLNCNLQRRVTDAKKFEFTKKLKLVKQG